MRAADSESDDSTPSKRTARYDIHYAAELQLPKRVD